MFESKFIHLLEQSNAVTAVCSWCWAVPVFRSALKNVNRKLHAERSLTEVVGSTVLLLHHAKKLAVWEHVWAVTCFIQSCVRKYTKKKRKAEPWIVKGDTTPEEVGRQIDRVGIESNFGGKKPSLTGSSAPFLFRIYPLWCRPLMTSCQAWWKHKTDFSLRPVGSWGGKCGHSHLAQCDERHVHFLIHVRDCRVQLLSSVCWRSSRPLTL